MTKTTRRGFVKSAAAVAGGICTAALSGGAEILSARTKKSDVRPLPEETTMQTTQITSTESAIWGRLLGPGGTTLPPEAARAILKIDFPLSDKERMRELAAKARQATLTPAEQDEIDSYGRIGSFISIMKSKARVALRKAQGNGS